MERKIMSITQDELTALINESDSQHVVDCAFGPGHVALNLHPSNAWAVSKVTELREIALVKSSDEAGLTLLVGRVNTPGGQALLEERMLRKG